MESWLQSEVITLKETRISNDIIIFAGTTEGRTLSEYLAAAGIAHTICVATEYGELVLKEHPLVTVHRGRMDEEAMREYLKQKAFAAVAAAGGKILQGGRQYLSDRQDQQRSAGDDAHVGSGFLPHLRLPAARPLPAV